MVNESFDDDDAWPDRQVLATWRVPSLPYDFADRVLAHASGAREPQRSGGRTSRSYAPLVAALVAALAVAAVLVLVFATRTPTTVETEVVPVVAPLPALPATTQLVLDVAPRDATVLVDGVAATGPAPFVVSGLAMGPHTIDVQRPGFVPVVKIVEVGREGLRLDLDLDIADVVLAVVVDPATAEVRVVAAGREIARGAGSQRFAVNRTGSDDIALEVSAPGYQPRRVPVRFSGAPQEALEITLVPVAASIPVKRKSTPSPDLKDPFGKAGRDDDNSATSSLKDPFAKPPAPAARRTSTLRIGVLAGDGPARVSIDGRVVGTTPIVNQRVTPGMHRIRWVWDDGHSFDKTITIADGEILLVKNG